MLRMPSGYLSSTWPLQETGTLFRCNKPDCRLVSTLPPVHAALVPTDRIVPTLQDALELYGRDPDGLPPYLAFISGPSRTADIERVRPSVSTGRLSFNILSTGREVRRYERHVNQRRYTGGPFQ